jgi:hypothetical protein
MAQKEERAQSASFFFLAYHIFDSNEGGIKFLRNVHWTTKRVILEDRLAMSLSHGVEEFWAITPYSPLKVGRRFGKNVSPLSSGLNI